MQNLRNTRNYKILYYETANILSPFVHVVYLLLIFLSILFTMLFIYY